MNTVDVCREELVNLKNVNKHMNSVHKHQCDVAIITLRDTPQT